MLISPHVHQKKEPYRRICGLNNSCDSCLFKITALPPPSPDGKTTDRERGQAHSFSWDAVSSSRPVATTPSSSFTPPLLLSTPPPVTVPSAPIATRKRAECPPRPGKLPGFWTLSGAGGSAHAVQSCNPS